MNQPDPDLTRIQQQIAFGLDVEAFMRSDMGKYLTARANDDMEAALQALKDVDAEDPKAIRRLQTAAAVAEAFLVWMAEAVNDGQNAERAFIEVTD